MVGTSAGTVSPRFYPRLIIFKLYTKPSLSLSYIVATITTVANAERMHNLSGRARGQSSSGVHKV